jgi:ubiquinone/menaquinone biosynthesis C-methylase UbiE
MSATSHLGIKFGAYDATIATLIPHYRDLIAAAAEAVDALAPSALVIVDLGTGTGALAEQIRRVRPRARFTGIDADEAMLALARKRLHGRIDTVTGNFERTSIPRCDVVSASFALHHIPTARRKASLYRRAAAALTRGGMLVSADCFLASTARLQSRHREAWLRHLQKKYSRPKAVGFLRTWAREDVYFTLEGEMAMLAAAGLKPEVTWRRDAFAVLVGVKRHP